ncbi:MAG: family 43 glycosylhydrolase [Clostridia bacterium]|nr:family 43 glycosylhydrolase [Clostridia bacterium]
MKLKFDREGAARTQPDPFIFEDGGRYYLYVTAGGGVEAYRTDDVFGVWNYIGVVTDFRDATDFWAPSVIKIDEKYYMYVSCIKNGEFEYMYVASSASPEGPFGNEKRLYGRFSIDSHMVMTESGLYLWFAQDNFERDKIGTRVWVDRFIDPYTPEDDPAEVLLPEFDEEKFTPQCTPERDWYTVEGPFWFREGEWQYLMYSAGCYMDDTYHVGYAVARSGESDLKKVKFEKVRKNGGFSPLIIKNRVEEGTGHNSVIRLGDDYYAIYHGRDILPEREDRGGERRTARICRLRVSAGVITAERE